MAKQTGKKSMKQKVNKNLTENKGVYITKSFSNQYSAQAKFGYKVATRAVKDYKQTLSWLGGGD